MGRVFAQVVILSFIFIYFFGVSVLRQSFYMHSHPFFYYTHLSLAITPESMLIDRILHYCSSERDLKVHFLHRE